MRAIRTAAAAALAAVALSACAEGWRCPVLNRFFDFPWGWPVQSADPPLTMESKYAIMAMDAGLDFYNHWMKWQPDYAPANQQQLVAGTVDDKMLSRNFIAGIYTRFATLINDNYHYTYRSGEQTNEVLAFAYNVEMGYEAQDIGTYFVVDDLRRVPPSQQFPNIGGSQAPDYAALAVSNAIHDILGVDATHMPSFTDPNGGVHDISDVTYTKSYPLTWGLAMDNRAFNPPECLQAGSFYPVVLDPFKAYLRHEHFLGNDIPQMFMHCKSRTPFNYTERKDVHTSTTTYLCQLTTNADDSATLKLTYVFFSTSHSNEYVHTRPISYGDKISGQSEAQGVAYGIGLENLKTRKAIIGEEIHREVYIPSSGLTKYCLLYPCGYAIDEERTWGERLDYDFVVKSHYITKGNDFARGFPAATCAQDWGQAWTLYSYECEGEDYYGGPVSYSGEGIEASGVASNNPYYVDFEYNSRAFDSDIYNISEALHTLPSIEVYYDQSNPEFTLGPFPHPTHPDMCIVVSVDDNYSTVGWMYTNTWNFVEDAAAGWIGAGPYMAEIVYPNYYEKDGDYLYELFPWELPFHFYVDMFASWISNKWGVWE